MLKVPTIYQFYCTNYFINFFINIGFVAITLGALTVDGMQALPLVFGNTVFYGIVYYLLYRRVLKLFETGLYVEGVVTSKGEVPLYPMSGFACIYNIDDKKYVLNTCYIDNKRTNKLVEGSSVMVIADKKNKFRALIKDAYV